MNSPDGTTITDAASKRAINGDFEDLDLRLARTLAHSYDKISDGALMGDETRCQ